MDLTDFFIIQVSRASVMNQGTLTMLSGPYQARNTRLELGLHTLVTSTSVTVEEELQYANVMIYNGHLYQIAQVRKHLVNNCSCQHINDQQTNDCL